MAYQQNRPIKLTLSELSEFTDSELRGDPDCKISGIAAIDQAGAGDLSFIHDGRYQSFLSTTQASAIILPTKLADSYSGNQLVNDDPYLAYARAVAALFPPHEVLAFIHPTAVIGEDVAIGQDVYVAAHTVIGNGCELEDRVRLGPGSILGDECVVGEASILKGNVSLGDRSRVGKRCLIHSGAVLGADGFGFAPQKNGKWYKITQIGNVVIGNDVEIGANTCIDRAAIGSTRVGDGVKLDNLIQIGHNAQIGEDTIIAANAAIAGSTKIGRRCRVGGAVAIAGHLEIADDVVITGFSMVTHSLRPAGVYSSGITADDNRSWRKNAARFRKLDDLFRRVMNIEKIIKS